MRRESILSLMLYSSYLCCSSRDISFLLRIRGEVEWKREAEGHVAILFAIFIISMD